MNTLTSKITFTALAASALATLTIGLAAPAFSAPSGTSGSSGNDDVTTVNDDYFNYPMTGQTQYGTYQNDNA